MPLPLIPLAGIPLWAKLVGAAGLVSGTSYWAYKTGNDLGLFRTISSALSSMFMEITILLMQVATILLSQLPDLPSSFRGQHSTISQVIEMGATMNQFMPVVETLIAFSAFMLFLLVFITVKFVLKLIPTIG